ALSRPGRHPLLRGMAISQVVRMNLYRWGQRARIPRAVGKVEGLQGGRIPAMVTSLTDGTEVRCRQAIVANATSFRVTARVATKIETTSVRGSNDLSTYVTASQLRSGVLTPCCPAARQDWLA